MKILLDTNFLVYCAENKIDYEEQINEIINEKHELFIPELVLNELKLIALKSEKYSDKEAAKLAIKLINYNKINIIKLRGKNADEAIIDACKKSNEFMAATLDLELRKKLIKSIVILSKKKLGIR